MANNQKTLWGEGVLLTPQHFQQWDRYHEAILRQRCRALSALDWGLCELDIDAEALLGGEFALRTCSGVLADGTHFDAPERDPVPGARSFVELFPPQSKTLGVFLAHPILRGPGLVCGDGSAEGDILTPYVARAVTVADDNQAGSEREVATAAMNLRILFEGEAREDYRVLEVARLAVTSTGGYELVESFVPTCLYVSVSPFLIKLLRRTIEILTAKSETLAGQQRKTGGMAEAMGFWLLHTVNTHLPELAHCYRQERVHPERLFLQLATLSAQLCTFAGNRNPCQLPLYDHTDVGACFGALDQELQQLLGAVIPTRCVPIPLDRAGEAMFSATVHDPRLLEESQLYLGVAADVHEDKVIAEFAPKAKISSMDQVQQLVMMATRGLGLKHVPVPPSEVPAQPGRTYFLLQKDGQHWEQIVQAHSIAFHIPPDFPGLKLELMAIKE